MTTNTQKSGHLHPKSNALLAALDPEAYEAVMSDARVVILKVRKRLYRQDDPVDAVFFPLNSMVSLLAGTDAKRLVETANIGREGVAGASEILQNKAAMGLHITLLPGDAVRVEAGAFRKHLDSQPALKSLVEGYQYALMRQVLHGSACNSLHRIEQRAARWLLMAHDRAGTDTFPITQEFLSKLLAVRRASINVATGMLKKAGLIRYVRGHLTVVDRAGLELASCACYAAIGKAYDYALRDRLFCSSA